RQADYAFTVLARALSWAKDRGKITVNPCERGGRVYSGSRVDHVLTLGGGAAVLKIAPAALQPPVVLGFWSGQGPGDLLGLTWNAYDGSTIRLRQSKSIGRRRRRVNVEIPVGAPLKQALDAAAKAKKSPIILLNSDDQPWTGDGFRASFSKARDKAGIVD